MLTGDIHFRRVIFNFWTLTWKNVFGFNIRSRKNSTNLAIKPDAKNEQKNSLSQQMLFFECNEIQLVREETRAKYETFEPKLPKTLTLEFTVKLGARSIISLEKFSH